MVRSSSATARNTTKQRVLLVFAFLTLLGFFSFSEMYVGPFAKQRPIVWYKDLLLELFYWYLLLPTAPVAYWFANRYPIERPHVGRRLAMHAAAGTLFALLNALAETFYALLNPASAEFYRGPAPFVEKYFRLVNNNLHFYLVIYVAIAGAAHAVGYYQGLRERERQASTLQLKASQLEMQLANAQLQALRMQVHPHFLFNALHSIAALVREGDRDAAVGMIVGLGDLLRMTLEKNGEKDVPLRRELEWLDKYLKIERVRFQDRLCTTIDAVPAALDAEVPYLILQPLVENSIRHGIAKRTGAATLEVRAWRDGSKLMLQVRDNGPGLPANSNPQSDGLGVKNVQARLQQRYGAQQSFELRNAEGGGAVATIKIPYSSRTQAPAP